MSKSVKILIALAAVVAMATPALAEFTLGGYFRTQGYMQNIETIDLAGGLVGDDDSDTQSLIDQRFRAKLGYTLNDYVSFVYYAEVDTTWGRSSKGSIGGGGQVGADGVNLETKNVYVDFKIPDTQSSLRLGIQGVMDAFEGVVFWDDMAAATMKGKLGTVDYSLLYSKWTENEYDEWDDQDLYGVDFSHKYGDFAKAGIAAYYLDDNTDPTFSSEVYWVGFYGDYRFGNVGIDGFFLYQGGEAEDETGMASDMDTSAWAATIRGKMVVQNGDLSLRYIYFSEDDDQTDDDMESFYLSQGNFEFVHENLSIFLVDVNVNNVAKNRLAIVDAVEGGYGLHALVASGNFKNLPMNTYAGFGAGAFFAAEDSPEGGMEREGKTLGYELAGKIGKKFADKFDVSLRGAYAILGDFYDKTAPEGDDPDDVWTTTLMVNVPF